MRVHSGVPIVQGGYNRVVGHYVLLTLHPSRSGTLLLLVSGTTPLSNKRRKAIVHKIIKGGGAGQSCDGRRGADDCKFCPLAMGRRYCLGFLFSCCALTAVALVALAAVTAFFFSDLLRGQVDQVRELPCPLSHETGSVLQGVAQLVICPNRLAYRHPTY